MSRRSVGNAAPYGQACMHCFKAKCKCIRHPGGNACERCQQLNKECTPADALRRRNTRKSQNATARIAELEGKLDGLTSLVQSLAKSANSDAVPRKVLDGSRPSTRDQLHPQSVPAEPLVTTPISFLHTTTNHTSVTKSAEATLPTSVPSSVPRPPSCCLCVNDSSHTGAGLYEPSADDSEAYLDVFRTRLLQHFAFVHLPAGQTSQQLRQDRPFLFRAIVAVVSPSMQQRIARGNELKGILARTVLLQNQSSIDLLLGLLTYLTWGYDQLLNSSGTLSRLMTVALSLAYDLRLNRPPPPDTHNIGPFVQDCESHDKDANEKTDQQFLERQRAVLGCFVLSSIVSLYYAQIDAMRWTPYMAECLQNLSINDNCPTDAELAFQTRLQLLAQKATHFREQQEMYHIDTRAKPAVTTFLYRRALQEQLRDLRGSLSPGLQRRETLIAHTHYVELHINETAYTANSNASLLIPLAASISGDVADFERLECLWSSVNAIKSWLDVFLRLSPSACLDFSFLSWAQLARCIVILFRLSTLDDPAWDCQAVRNTVDLPCVLERIIDKLERARREAHERSDDDPFTQFSRMARTFRAWMTAKLAPQQPEEGIVRPFGGAENNASDDIMDQAPFGMANSIDFGGNDKWLEEFLAGFG